MRPFGKAGLAALTFGLFFGGLSADAQEGKAKAADTCHVRYYCSGRDGSEQGPYDTTVGVEARLCATNSSRVIDGLRGACAVSGTLRVTSAIFGPAPQPVAQRCTIGFRCPGNSQTLRLSFQTSEYGCKAGYTGEFRNFKQDIPYNKYHNEFTRQIAFICPSASKSPSSSGLGRSPTHVDSFEWAVPSATPAVNPNLNCVCTTRCYGPTRGWSDELEFTFQTPFTERACLNGYFERTSGVCRARGGSDSWPQPTRNLRYCVESFATGDTTGSHGVSSADWGSSNQSAKADWPASPSHDWGVKQ